MSRRVTLKDIARATGFHVSTVSRALDSNAQIALTEEAVRQIRETADVMGYRRNPMAFGLRTNRSMTIGVVIPDITNSLFPPILRGIESVLEPDGYASFIVNTDNDPEREVRLVDVLVERGVDGIVHASTFRDDDSVAALAAQSIPVVTLNRRAEGLSVPSVLPDDAAGIRLLMQHLAEHGHRRIGHIAGPASLSTGIARREAFVAMQDVLGLDPTACPVVGAERFEEAEGYRCADELLAGDLRFTALLCGNDRLALGAIRCLRERGLDCPGDISVTGFNDLALLDMISPGLTTIRIPQFEAGRTAAKLLLSMLRRTAAGSPENVVLPVELVVRESVAAARDRRTESGPHARPRRAREPVT